MAMTETKSRVSLAVGITMLAGMVVLAACDGPSPIRTTTEQTTTTTPRPAVSTTTTTTDQTR
jgi:uncharacterized lipoprotein YajG